jgi:hypothetical protein
MGRKSRFILILFAFILAFAQVAFAGLAQMGPVNPVAAPGNGYPMWYKDANGVTVDLPIPPTGDGVTAPTMIYAPVIAGNAYSAQTGFGAEAFYFNAHDNKNFNTKDGKGTFLLGLEAGYAGGANPAAGQQVVFARIRCTASVKTAGTYTFFHPWGSEVINVTATDVQKQPAIKFTKDVGIGPGWLPNGTGGWNLVAAPGGFYTVLDPSNTISTFLRQLSPAPPAGWIGDGVTPATVTGSPIGYNKVRLQGPAGVDMDGRGNNFIEVTQMIVSGHIPLTTTVPLPLSVDRVTCSHIGAVEKIDFWITTRPGAAIAVNDVNPANGSLGALLYSDTVTDLSGKYYASFPGTSKLVAVTVTDPAGAFSAATKTAAVIDYVDIISAAYSEVTLPGTLTIQATSSDYFFTTKRNLAPPVLTATGFGNLSIIDAVNGIYSLTVVPIPGVLPPTITVTSSVGGSATVPTALVQ